MNLVHRKLTCNSKSICSAVPTPAYQLIDGDEFNENIIRFCRNWKAYTPASSVPVMLLVTWAQQTTLELHENQVILKQVQLPILGIGHILTQNVTTIQFRWKNIYFADKVLHKIKASTLHYHTNCNCKITSSISLPHYLTSC